jgi:hypothetical protein
MKPCTGFVAQVAQLGQLLRQTLGVSFFNIHLCRD